MQQPQGVLAKRIHPAWLLLAFALCALGMWAVVEWDDRSKKADLEEISRRKGVFDRLPYTQLSEAEYVALLQELPPNPWLHGLFRDAGQNNNTALIRAALRTLEPNASDLFGGVYGAASTGAYDSAKILIDSGAPVELPPYDSPLYKAVEAEDARMIELLLLHGANPNGAPPPQPTLGGPSPTPSPSSGGGANPVPSSAIPISETRRRAKLQPYSARVPLTLAAALGRADLVAMLLTAGADPRRENFNKKTPLDAAKFSKDKETIRLIEDALRNAKP